MRRGRYVLVSFWRPEGGSIPKDLCEYNSEYIVLMKYENLEKVKPLRNVRRLQVLELSEDELEKLRILLELRWEDNRRVWRIFKEWIRGHNVTTSSGIVFRKVSADLIRMLAKEEKPEWARILIKLRRKTLNLDEFKKLAVELVEKFRELKGIERRKFWIRWKGTMDVWYVRMRKGVKDAKEKYEIMDVLTPIIISEMLTRRGVK